MKAAWLAAALAVAGCKKEPAPRTPTAPDAAAAAPAAAVGPEARKAGARVAAVPLRSGPAMTGYGVIVLAGTDTDALQKKLSASLRSSGFEAYVSLGTLDEIGFLPESLAYKGRGLDDAAITSIRGAQTILVLAAEAPVEQMVELELAAVAAVHDAIATGGWIYDPGTSEVFSRAAFAEARVGQSAIDVRRWVSIHFVSQDNGLAFLETRGLERFGVPELYLGNVPRAASDGASDLVNAAAQLLVERGALTADGELAVPGPKGTVRWTVTWSTGDYGAGTPPVLLELTPPGTGDPERRIYEAIELHGGAADDPAIGVDHDDPELKAASARAKKELAALAKHFAKGIPEMEQLIVKGPFPTGDGDENEWMWVEVHAWKGKTLSGVLLNQPELIDDLNLGDRVEIRLDDVYDYMHRRADGTEAGGETVEIMQRKYVR